MRVRLTRGPAEESVHEVHAAVVAADGSVEVWGDPALVIQPRSAIKFVQALPLLTTGAADRFAVTDDELALACSSHNGEQAHLAAVEGWLRRIGLDESALECGPDRPLGEQARLDFDRAGLDPAARYNCCSGKHTGFLTVAQALGVDPAGYIEPDHPVQRAVTGAVEALTGVDTARRRFGRDGCGIPVHAIELDAMAGAMSRLVTGRDLDDDTAAACSRLVEATADRAFWVAGTGRHETVLEDRIGEPVLSKTGAEGVFVAALPERGVGLALKVLDGATRAAEIAVSALLARQGVLDPARARRQLRNKAGRPVGWMEAVVPEPVRLTRVGGA